MAESEVTGKIARKYMAHFIDATFGGVSPTWERLGKDLEEYNVEMNPDTESVTNILGENSFRNNGYEISSEADPYYANTEDAIFPKLQEIVDTRATDDTCKTKALEVHLWDETETSGTYVAYQEDVYVVPTSYGGDTSGYQIPFTVNYVGNRVKGAFALSTKTFTPDGSEL